MASSPEELAQMIVAVQSLLNFPIEPSRLDGNPYVDAYQTWSQEELRPELTELRPRRRTVVRQNEREYASAWFCYVVAPKVIGIVSSGPEKL